MSYEGTPFNAPLQMFPFPPLSRGKKSLPFPKMHFYAIFFAMFPLINAQKYFAWLSFWSFPATMPILSQIGDVKLPPMVHSLMHPLLISGRSLRLPPPKWGKVWRASALEGRQAMIATLLILYYICTIYIVGHCLELHVWKYCTEQFPQWHLCCVH